MATSTLGSGTLVLAGTTSGTTTVTATAVAGTTTLTLPAATDTLVGKATTDTLTNKTLTSPTITGAATFAAGTAAAPAITTTGDTNTGIWFPAADTIAFTEGGVESMRIDSSGNLGIGTTSPSSKLHVKSTVNDSTNGLTLEYNAGTAYYGRIFSSGNDLIISADTGNTGGTMRLLTGGTERARIDSSGNLLVGKTAVDLTVAGTQLESAGTVAITRDSAVTLVCNRKTNDGTIVSIRRDNTEVGSISATTTLTSYNVTSDYRLKNAIAPMTGALAKVALLKPCTYKWNVNGSDGEGFIAHELAEVVPHAVTGEKDAVDADGNPKHQGIDVSFLVATLTAAIQEQQALIVSMREEIEALKIKVGT